jgi:hypothetical protein
MIGIVKSDKGDSRHSTFQAEIIFNLLPLHSMRKYKALMGRRSINEACKGMVINVVQKTEGDLWRKISFSMEKALKY